jgi:hypothetical protein
MFSLVISVVAVALVVLLGLATFYYGGSAIRSHGSQAKAAQVVLEGQQISAAVDIYRSKNNGALPASLDTLTANGEYLSAKPNSSWNYSTEYVMYPMTDVEACKKANAVLGMTLQEVPLCSAVPGKVICCQQDPTP